MFEPRGWLGCVVRTLQAFYGAHLVILYPKVADAHALSSACLLWIALEPEKGTFLVFPLVHIVQLVQAQR